MRLKQCSMGCVFVWTVGNVGEECKATPLSVPEAAPQEDKSSLTAKLPHRHSSGWLCDSPCGDFSVLQALATTMLKFHFWCCLKHPTSGVCAVRGGWSRTGLPSRRPLLLPCSTQPTGSHFQAHGHFALKLIMVERQVERTGPLDHGKQGRGAAQPQTSTAHSLRRCTSHLETTTNHRWRPRVFFVAILNELKVDENLIADPTYSVKSENSKSRGCWLLENSAHTFNSVMNKREQRLI